VECGEEFSDSRFELEEVFVGTHRGGDVGEGEGDISF